MKQYLIVAVLGLSGCLAVGRAPDLSQLIVGRWRMTQFDGYGTPMTNALLILEFTEDGTWESRVSSKSVTNVYHGTYSVLEDQVTLASPESGEPEDWDRYTYSNGVLESLAPSRKSIGRKISIAGSAGIAEGSIYPKIAVIHVPDTINLFALSNATERTVYLEVNPFGSPVYQINYKATDGLDFAIAPAGPATECKALEPHGLMFFAVILTKPLKPYSAWQVDTIAYASPHAITKLAEKTVRDLGPFCRARSPWMPPVEKMAQQDKSSVRGKPRR